jgi:hypothetical protein
VEQAAVHRGAPAARAEGLPEKEPMLRRVHSWESGASCPDDFYKPVIAKTFGTVTTAIWPVAGHRDGNAELVTEVGSTRSKSSPGCGHRLLMTPPWMRCGSP